MATLPFLQPPDGWNIFNPAGWGSETAGVVADDDATYRLSGDYALKMTGLTTAFYSDPQPIVLGKFYRLEVAAYFIAINASQDKLRARAEMGSGLGGYVFVTASNDVAPSSAGWNYLSGVGWADPNHVTSGDCNAVVRVERPTGAGSNAIYLDHAELRPCGGMFRVERATSNQSIANATDTTVVFNSASLDPAGLVDLSTGVFNAIAAGPWRFEAGASWDVSAGTNEQLRILHNGNIIAQVNDVGLTGVKGRQAVVSGVLDLAMGDSVAIQVRQNSGAGLNINNDVTTFFSGHELAA